MTSHLATVYNHLRQADEIFFMPTFIGTESQVKEYLFIFFNFHLNKVFCIFHSIAL